MEGSQSLGNLDLRTRFFAGLDLSSKARLREESAALADGKEGTPASSRAAASMPAMRRATGVKVSASEDTVSGEVRAWDAT